MPQESDKIKATSEGPALQARKAIQNAGIAGRDVIVYGFDDLLMIVSKKSPRVGPAHRAELVSAGAEESDSIYFGLPSTVSYPDDECLVYLPGCEAAGIHEGDKPDARGEEGVLFVYKHNYEAVVLYEELHSIRRGQI